MHRGAVITVLFLSLLIDLNAVVFAAAIEGNVKDAVTGEALYGANIILVGTGLGAASDLDGNYKIQGVNPGTYTIRVSYIGYNTPEMQIVVKEGKPLKQDFSLDPVGLEGQTVVVTAQALGQKQAINQQLTSDQITNVVSKAKIQELPDANAAESVGRLPGVSVLRNGGEGTSVVIRGMQPKYNTVLIDGIKMSATGSDNRSSDLSMVSSNMLEGIEVSKSVTADMDAEVIGGTVNFELLEARTSVSGVPEFNLDFQGGYNGLSNLERKFNNYKYIGSVENRFFNDKLGVFLQLDMERRNLGSNEMGASYDQYSNSDVEYLTTALNLYKISRDKQRYNAALVTDYKLPDGEIKFTNFFSSGESEVINRGETFNISSNSIEYWVNHSNSKLNILTNGLFIKQDLPWFSYNARFSHSYSETKDPDGWDIRFTQTSAGLNSFMGKTDVDPRAIPVAASKDYSDSYLNTITTHTNFSRERALTGSLDLKKNVNFSDLISAEFKLGGKYRYQTRSYDYEYYDGNSLNGSVQEYVDFMLCDNLGIPRAYKIMVNYFIDPEYSYGEFLDGDYNMSVPLNYAMLAKMIDVLKANKDDIAAKGHQVSYARNTVESTTYDHTGHEHHSAFYLMSTVKYGDLITFIPGVRYQNLTTTYTGARGIMGVASADPYNHYDTTVTHVHDYWLPDISLKIKPLPWLDLRLSYTNTLAYPDYGAIIPRINMASGSIAYVNHNLIPSRSTNYDAYLSIYDNTLGLFTVGGFLKKIDNLIYSWSFYVSGEAVIPYLPHSLMPTYKRTGNYVIWTFVNNSYVIDNYGMELDWQTHFWYLPGPLSGLVFSANYTHIFSKAEYPFTYTKVSGRTTSFVDSSFTAPLIYQPDDIVNLSLGYDYKDFSIRVSMLYQSDIFTGADFWPQLRSHTKDYTRWDLSAKQNLPWFGIQIYGDINNLNGAKDVSIIQGGGVPTSEQDYGMTADFGIRIKL
jgi:TonB-dependent receptor